MKMPPRRMLGIAAAAVLVVVLLAVRACTRDGTPAASRAAGPPPVPVVAVMATKGDIGVYLTGLGGVTPLATVTVRTRIDGQLMKVLYREGQIVHEGDLLAEIDARPFQAQLLQAQGQLARDRALLEEARIDLARYQRLWKQDSVAKQTLDQQAALVRQYEGTVQFDQGQIDAAATNVDYCRISSPVTGRVGLRLVDPGNIVHAADATGLLVVTQLEPITVIFTIAEDHLPTVYERLNAGEPLVVEAYDRAQQRKLATGSLLTVDNQVDPTTGTVRAKAVFANPDDVLFPQQFVNARLEVERKRDVTLIPDAAVQRSTKGTFAYVVKPDHTVTARAVTVGTTEGGHTEIAAGLSPGDVVVVTGVDRLAEGTKVEVQPTADTPEKKG